VHKSGGSIVQTSNEDKHNNPLYAQILHFYRVRILSGEFPVGTQLPTEMEIAQQHQMSRGTVRQALNMLVTEGLLERIQGRGTFVRSSSLLTQNKKFEESEEKSIGLILSGSINDELSMDILVGVEQGAKSRGYHLKFAFAEDNAQQLAFDIASLRTHTAGLVIFPLSDIEQDEAIDQLKHDKIPFVLIDRYLPAIESDYVGVDNVGGGYRATEHLIALGHIHIGFAYSCSGGFLTTSVHDRWEGYQKALKAYDLPYDETLLLRDAPVATAEPPNVYDEYLLHPNRPSAIFAVNDSVALGLLQAAQRCQISVPEELAIIGFDDISYAAHVHPPLTTIAQPRKEIGLRAAHLLLDRIEGQADGPSRCIELPTRLIVRESCGMRLKVKKQRFSSHG
jgi:GntR family transcriptional regulator, arabinose operon transcriptional repressor